MSLRLDDQICFPLYAAARAVQQRYRPLLTTLGLTYPQYLVLLVLWEEDGLSVGDLGERLLLDSGTLTPLLKRLTAAGLVTRRRAEDDGRVVLVHLTKAGVALQAQAEAVPRQLVACLAPHTDGLNLPELHRSLHQLLRVLKEAP